MSTLYKLSLLGILSLSAVSSHGDTFDFSYTFADNYYSSGFVTEFSGSFQGIRNGIFVDNVTDVSLFFNGIPVNGPIYTATYNPILNRYVNGALVSFDVTMNNFLFINSDYANNGNQVATDYAYADSFPASLPNLTGPYTVAIGLNNPFGGLVETFDIPSVQANWTLTDVSSSVPDGGSTVAMFGTALAGFAFIRRKF